VDVEQPSTVALGDPSPTTGAGAPAVVAVMVTHNPGEWFEQALDGLAAQDYPALSVLIVDADSDADPAARVAPVLPTAYVRRLDHNPGFGPSANEALRVVEGAAFYAVCHDDVALAPDAVRVMVEEAFRSNAGVVGPKLVSWDDDRELRQVGMAADKTGVLSPYVEPGELDQEQHDAVRDVFVVPGGCTLVRADLFAALSGFDPAIALLGEDLDLCWRAQVAGARVMVAPAAVARHLEELGERRPVDDRRQLQARHRLRTMLTCYGPFHLLRVLPQAALLALVEIVYALVAGRVGQARDIAGAWTWNLRRHAELRVRRRRVQQSRRVPDSEVRRLQVHGSARFASFLRGQIGRGDDRARSMSDARRNLVEALGDRQTRVVVGAWVMAVLLFLVGSRVLIFDKVPPLADLPAFPSRPWSLFGEWLSGWRSAGLGSEGPAPTGLALVGLGGVATLAQMGLLRMLLVVGLLPLGALGAWRLSGALGSQLARAVALVVFVAIPLPYNAIATGRWGGLAIWAATPFVLHGLVRSMAVEPFDEASGTRRHRVLGLGLVVAVTAAAVPLAVLAPLVVAAALVAGSFLAGRAAGSVRVLGTAVGAVCVAVVLHLPWTLGFVSDGFEWSPFGGVRGGVTFSIGELARFETGPIGAAPLGWVFIGVALLPLLIGRDWRLAWAVRGWALALAGWALAWSGQQDWFPVPLGPPEGLLAPAAAGLALAAALGLVAFEVDLRGYRFGWRQMASVLAAAGVVVGVVPVLAASANGRWKAPAGDGAASALGFLDDEPAEVGPFRVLWLGDPGLLPLGGWELDDGVAYATSDEGLPDIADRWPASSHGPTRLVADSLDVAADRQTSRLGRLLAPMGVRYVVLPDGEGPSGGERRVVTATLSTVLAEQLDLVALEVDPQYRVYRNEAWAPTRTVLPPEAEATGSDFLTAATGTDLAGAPPVLTEGDGYARWTGDLEDLDDDVTLYLAAAASERWELRVGGATARRAEAFGWANSFDVRARASPGDGSGDEPVTASLRYRTEPVRYLFLAAQVALWLVVVRTVRAGRRRARQGPQPVAGRSGVPR